MGEENPVKELLPDLDTPSEPSPVPRARTTPEPPRRIAISWAEESS